MKSKLAQKLSIGIFCVINTGAVIYPHLRHKIKEASDQLRKQTLLPIKSTVTLATLGAL